LIPTALKMIWRSLDIASPMVMVETKMTTTRFQSWVSVSVAV
jgi:hypothetical protein